MRKKWIGLVLAFALVTVIPFVSNDATPTDNGEVAHYAPSMALDPGHGGSG
ncbi:hypothetical protein [Paraliobacillus sp. JSM ZJ581]|uniref:hypothetical protein n=1 Tax=Paraliobacillus sp. JSM ZJ581 TaxID=3342118 RepID=UPI0035A94A9F